MSLFNNKTTFEHTFAAKVYFYKDIDVNGNAFFKKNVYAPLPTNPLRGMGALGTGRVCLLPSYNFFPRSK